MMNIRYCLAVAGLLFPALSLAEASNYTYAEAGFLDGDQANMEMTGWGFTGSAELVDRVFLRAGASNQELDEDRNNFDLDVRSKTLGLGYVLGENSTASVYGLAGYTEQDVDVISNGASSMTDEQGSVLELGARMNLSLEAELKVAVSHTDFGGGNEETVPEGELVYRFTPQIAGSVNYRESSGDSILGLGIRFYF